MKYQKLWTILLVVSGLMTLLAVLYPDSIVFGLFFGVVGGVLLMVAPSFFVYGLLFTLLLTLLRRFGKKRLILAPAILIGGGLAASYFLNQGTYEKLEALTADDKDMVGSVGVRKSVAILTAPVPYRQRTRKEAPACVELCQRLLYNGAAERVLIGYIREADRGNFTNVRIKAYYVENRDVCPAVRGTLEAVSLRMAAGECLLSEESAVGEADIVYLTERIIARRNFEYYDRHDLTIVAVSARRKSILEKTAGGYQSLFRKTEIHAQPLFYPLLFSAVFRQKGGGDIVTGTGFIRSRLFLNNLENFAGDEEPRIFAQAAREVKKPRPAKSDVERRLILKALQNKDEQRQAGHDVFSHYLESFANEKDEQPDAEDVSLVIEALQDQRITDFDRIWAFIQKLESVSDEMIVAMADRILKSSGQRFVVKSLSREIGRLPDGRAAIVSPQILQMLQDSKLRTLASDAVSRLGDGEARAAEYYASDIEAWRLRAIESYVYRREPPRGALIGLCRMGERAAGAKEPLFRLLETLNDRFPPDLILRALLAMGFERELRSKYRSHDHWTWVEGTIESWHHAKKSGWELCKS